MGDTYSFVMRKKYHTCINTFISVAPQLYIQHKIYSTATWPGGWEIDGPELLNLAANQHSSSSFHLAGAVFLGFCAFLEGLAQPQEGNSETSLTSASSISMTSVGTRMEAFLAADRITRFLNLSRRTKL